MYLHWNFDHPVGTKVSMYVITLTNKNMAPFFAFIHILEYVCMLPSMIQSKLTKAYSLKDQEKSTKWTL